MNTWSPGGRYLGQKDLSFHSTQNNNRSNFLVKTSPKCQPQPHAKETPRSDMTVKVLRYKTDQVGEEGHHLRDETGQSVSIIYLPGADNPVMNRLSCQPHSSLQSDCLSVLIHLLYKQETQSSHLSRSVVLNTFSVKDPFEGWKPFAYHLRELTETLQSSPCSF